MSWQTLLTTLQYLNVTPSPCFHSLVCIHRRMPRYSLGQPPALPTDVWLCDLIRIQRIAEAGALTFSMDDPGAVVTLRDIRVQYSTARLFVSKLDYWRRHSRTNFELAVSILFINLWQILISAVSSLRPPRRSMYGIFSLMR